MTISLGALLVTSPTIARRTCRSDIRLIGARRASPLIRSLRDIIVPQRPEFARIVVIVWSVSRAFVLGLPLPTALGVYVDCSKAEADLGCRNRTYLGGLRETLQADLDYRAAGIRW